MQALLGIAYKKGVTILNNMEVDKITDGKTDVETTFKNNLSLKSKKVIIATNGFAKQLLPTFFIVS